MADETQFESLEAFGKSIKAKYPQYANLPDEELGNRVLAKFPQYVKHVKLTPGAAKRSVTAGLTADYSLETEEFGEKHPVLGPPMRTLSAIGGTVMGLPGQLYHAVADPLTPEETSEFKGHRQISGEVTIERLTGAPLVRGVEQYIDPKTRPTASQALSVLPEAIGTGAGAYVGGELLGRGLSKVGQLRKTLSEKYQPTARRLTEATQGAKSAVEDTAAKQAKALAENKVKRIETVKENLRATREANTKIEQEKLAAAEKNKPIEAKNAAEQAKVTQRGELAKTVDEQSVALGKTIQQVEANVYKAADEKFTAVRAKIGNPEAPAEPLIESVKNVEKATLQGIPENIKEFRSILKMEGGEEGPLAVGGGGEVAPGEPGYPAVKEAYIQEGLLKEGEPLTWDKLQSLKSRIDARLRSRTAINGDLKRGLFQIRDEIVDQMGNMAEASGAGELWTDAKNFWRQMREDFHEPTGPSGSGSPVAQALDAVDPKNIRQPFLRTKSAVGNRAIDILRKYPQYGGTEAATQAEALLSSYETMTGLPKKAKVTALETAPEVHKMPASKPAPPIPEKPTVDVRQVAREKIASTAERVGRINARDAGIIASSTIGGVVGYIFNLSGTTHGASTLVPVAMLSYEMGKYFLSQALDKPKVVEWIANTPPAELQALQNIKGAELVNIKNGITEAAVQSKATSVSPQLRSFLGPGNVSRIVAASAVAGKPPVKNRKEALDLLQPTAH